MASWQPPIPSGALYGKPARQLGPALALLAYCYDIVQKDGWFDISIKEAASDMDTDYRTMRRWWQEVIASGFFREVIDRGRHGYRVRFKDGCLDWRILNARQAKDFTPTDDKASRPDEGSSVSLENLEGQMKAISRPDEGSSVSLERTAYKDDIHDQKTIGTARKKCAPSSDHQKLLAAYQDALGYKIPNGAKEAVAAQKILKAGYTVEQVIDVYQNLKGGFWLDKHVSLHTVYEQMGAVLNAPARTPGTNGHKPADSRPALEPFKPKARPQLSPAEMKAALEKARSS